MCVITYWVEHIIMFVNDVHLFFITGSFMLLDDYKDIHSLHKVHAVPNIQDIDPD